jgi:hypothetical protein
MFSENVVKEIRKAIAARQSNALHPTSLRQIVAQKFATN